MAEATFSQGAGRVSRRAAQNAIDLLEDAERLLVAAVEPKSGVRAKVRAATTLLSIIKRYPVPATCVLVGGLLIIALAGIRDPDAR